MASVIRKYGRSILVVVLLILLFAVSEQHRMVVTIGLWCLLLLELALKSRTWDALPRIFILYIGVNTLQVFFLRLGAVEPNAWTAAVLYGLVSRFRPL